MTEKQRQEFAETFSPELRPPAADTMDAYLDAILPAIRQWSEDLREKKFYVNKPWMEIRDDVNFHDTILHFFNEGGNHMIVKNGDVRNANWKYMASANKLILSAGKGKEMFELVFMNQSFFILIKHGYDPRVSRKKYRVYGIENHVKRLEWRDAMLALYNQYRTQESNYVMLTVIVLVVIAIIVALSLF